MNRPVILRPEAIADLESARQWYEENQQGFGDVFANRAATALQKLADAPQLFAPIWRNVRAAAIRRHPYAIYFRIHPAFVEVLAILHASRDASVWKSRA